jgi:hypothetical protein
VDPVPWQCHDLLRGPGALPIVAPSLAEQFFWRRPSKETSVSNVLGAQFQQIGGSFSRKCARCLQVCIGLHALVL